MASSPVTGAITAQAVWPSRVYHQSPSEPTLPPMMTRDDVTALRSEGKDDDDGVAVLGAARAGAARVDSSAPVRIPPGATVLPTVPDDGDEDEETEDDGDAKDDVQDASEVVDVEDDDGDRGASLGLSHVEGNGVDDDDADGDEVFSDDGGDGGDGGNSADEDTDSLLPQLKEPGGPRRRRRAD